MTQALALKTTSEWDDWVPPTPVAVAPSPTPPMAASDRRIAARVARKLEGRCMVGNRAEFSCVMRDVSLTGLAVDSEHRPDLGDKVIAYVNDLPRIEGKVARIFDGGFAINYDLPALKREKMESLLDKLGKEDPANIIGRRASERIVLNDPETVAKHMVTDPDGNKKMVKSAPALVRNMSRKGAAFTTEMRLRSGDTIWLGEKLRGTVVRVFAGGVAIEFFRLIPLQDFSSDLKP